MDHRTKRTPRVLRPDIATAQAHADAARLRAALSCIAAELLRAEAARLREDRREIARRRAG